MFKYITEKTGFTLVETLVAISILMLAIVGPMGFIADGIVQSHYAKDQIVAFYLAQEGVELIREQRDRVALDLDANPSRPWLQFIAGQCKNLGQGCAVSVRATRTGGVPVSPSCAQISDPSEACRIYKDTSIGAAERGIYHHSSSGSVATPYRRVVTVDESENQDAEIISTVFWRTGYLPMQKVRVRGYIYNQYNNLFTP